MAKAKKPKSSPKGMRVARTGRPSARVRKPKKK